MKPFHDYVLRNVLANQWQSAAKKIDKLTNEEIMANDLDILADNIYQEFFIEPIILYEEDSLSRSIKQEKIKIHSNSYGDELEVDGFIGSFYYPYQGDAMLFQCKASTVSLSPYPNIEIEPNRISFHITKRLDEMKRANAKDELLHELELGVTHIKQGINFANNDVQGFNSNLKEKALKELMAKREKVQSFFDIAQMLEISLEKKEFAKKHIPLTRRTIVPITHKYEREEYYNISDLDYEDILGVIKHTVSTYETTPSSYRCMKEEDLRNTLLGALNGLYKGMATGEAFRNKGKTDICIEMNNRAAFVAECKMWTGKAEIVKAINQLDNYLTWRDCKTALIFFVRRKNFLSIIENVDSILREVETMRSVRILDKNEFECVFLSKSNPGQSVKMRVMFFNLYSE